MLDHAVGSRKIHGKAIPRLGGIGIVCGFYAPLTVLLLYETSLGEIFYANRQQAFALLGGGVAIALLGIYDDLRGATAVKKFAVQFAIAGTLYAAGFRIDQIATPFGQAIPLGPLAIPFTLLWIVGVINALNLIDGLDGLAGGVALFAIGTTFAITFMRGEPLMTLFMACLGGAVLGFLFYNFNPASIFMGDTGSMFLGFVLAAGSLRTSQKSSTAVAILVPIVALGLPIADTLAAMVRRALRGRPLFSADKEHIHHRLLALGFSQKQAVIVLYGVCTVLGGAALLLTFASSAQTAIVLGALALLGFFGLRRLGYLKVGAGSLAVERRRNQELRRAARELGKELDDAGDGDAIWSTVKAFARSLDADTVALSRVSRQGAGGGERVVTTYTTRPSDGNRAATTGRTATFQIHGIDDVAGALELEWNLGRSLTYDEEVAVEIFCEHIATALTRTGPPAQPPRRSAERATVPDVRPRNLPS